MTVDLDRRIMALKARGTSDSDVAVSLRVSYRRVRQAVVSFERSRPANDAASNVVAMDATGEEDGCRWIDGDVRERPKAWDYCRARRAGETSYCAGHLARAYTAGTGARLLTLKVPK